MLTKRVLCVCTVLLLTLGGCSSNFFEEKCAQGHYETRDGGYIVVGGIQNGGVVLPTGPVKVFVCDETWQERELHQRLKELRPGK